LRRRNFGRCGGLIRGTRKAPGHHHPGAFLLFGGYVHIRVLRDGNNAIEKTAA
jgi:hypothetical protein